MTSNTELDIPSGTVNIENSEEEIEVSLPSPPSNDIYNNPTQPIDSFHNYNYVPITIESNVEFHNEDSQETVILSGFNNTGGNENQVCDTCVADLEELSEEERPSKKGKYDNYEDEEGCICSICFDMWTTAGEHRLCCLECGHLFGHSCLIRWLKNENRKSCPTCKKKVNSLKEVRFIYAKKLIALDTTDLEETKAQLEYMTKQKQRLLNKVQNYYSREICLQKIVSNLKKEIQLMKDSTQVTTSSQNFQDSNLTDVQGVKIYLARTLEVNQGGGCRVFDFNKNTNVMAVSMKSNNTVFTGYGIKKLMLDTFKCNTYIHLHTKPIRDISFHSTFDWLLSVSFDNKVKLLDVYNQSVISSFPRNSEIWSCCWDSIDSNYFFIGEARGVVSKFDIRNPTEPVCTLDGNEDFSPVISLASAKFCPGNFTSVGALICCQLNSCSIHDQNLTTNIKYPVPMEGPFMCASYDNKSQHLLVSARPNRTSINSRHSVFNMIKNDDNSLIVNNVHTFAGARSQKLMSRSCQFMYKDNMYVAAHQETFSNVAIWNVKNGRTTATVPATLPVLDICSIEVNNECLLATLNEKKVNFFKIE